MAATLINRRLVLASRPVGIPVPEHFRRDDCAIPALAAGQFLVRNLFLSIDPAQRGWVNAASNYSAAVPIGEVMRSLAVGVIVESRNADQSVARSVCLASMASRPTSR